MRPELTLMGAQPIPSVGTMLSLELRSTSSVV